MPPVSPLQALQLSNLLKIDKPAPIGSGIAVGDHLEMAVLKNLVDGKVLIRLGSESVRADSAVPLRAGETVMVRVEETHPSLLLSVIDSARQESDRVTELLRFQRSNPEGLLRMMTDLPAAFEAKNISPFLPYVSKENVETLLKLLAAVQLSDKTSEGQLFFKSFIDNLGLLWENGLKKALQEGADTGRAGLKGVLAELSDELRTLAGNRNLFDTDARRQLDAMQKTTADAIKTLESEQVMNVLRQENENRYLFQIPFLLPSGSQMADICVSFEGKGAKGEGHGTFRILFLLNLDALGDVSVETGITSRRVDCRIRCTNRIACEFVSQSLKRLEDGLTGLGFQIESLTCLYEDDLSEVREQFQEARVMEGNDSVNIFI